MAKYRVTVTSKKSGQTYRGVVDAPTQKQALRTFMRDLKRSGHTLRNPQFFTDAEGQVHPERKELGAAYDPMKTVATLQEARELARRGLIPAEWVQPAKYEGADPHGYITPRELRGISKRPARTKAMKALERQYIESFPARRNPTCPCCAEKRNPGGGWVFLAAILGGAFLLTKVGQKAEDTARLGQQPTAPTTPRVTVLLPL